MNSQKISVFCLYGMELNVCVYVSWTQVSIYMRETWVRSLGWEDPLEEGTATHSSILAWRLPWTEETGGYSSWGCKESDMTEWLSMCVCIYIYIYTHTYILKEGMATHSSILAWRIPMDRGLWRSTVHEVTRSLTWLSD